MKRIISLLLLLAVFVGTYAQIEEFSDNILDGIVSVDTDNVEASMPIIDILAPMDEDFPQLYYGKKNSSKIFTNAVGYHVYYSKPDNVDYVVGFSPNYDTAAVVLLEKGQYEITGYLYCEDHLNFIQEHLANENIVCLPVKLPSQSKGCYNLPDTKEVIRRYLLRARICSMSVFNTVKDDDDEPGIWWGDGLLLEITDNKGWKFYIPHRSLYLSFDECGRINTPCITDLVLIDQFESCKNWLMKEPLLMSFGSLLWDDITRHEIINRYNDKEPYILRLPDYKKNIQNLQFPLHLICKKVVLKNDELVGVFSVNNDSIILLWDLDLKIYGLDMYNPDGFLRCMQVSSEGLVNYDLKLFHESEFNSCLDTALAYDAEQVRLTKLDEEKRRQAFEEAERLKRERTEKILADARASETQRKAKLIQQFGNEYGSLIFQHKIKVGMTKDMCIKAWGRPNHVQMSGNDEIWRYSSVSIVVFRNGIIRSISM